MTNRSVSPRQAVRCQRVQRPAPPAIRATRASGILAAVVRALRARARRRRIDALLAADPLAAAGLRFMADRGPRRQL